MTMASSARVYGVVERVSRAQSRLPCELLRLFVLPDAPYPNNARFPVLLYHKAHSSCDLEVYRHPFPSLYGGNGDGERMGRSEGFVETPMEHSTYTRFRPLTPESSSSSSLVAFLKFIFFSINILLLIIYCCRDGAALLEANGWLKPWGGQVFDYHHYHTLAWEALLCVYVRFIMISYDSIAFICLF